MDIKNCIRKQEASLSKLANSISKELEKAEQEHMKKLENESVYDIYKSLGGRYPFEKMRLYENNSEYAKRMYDMIKQAYTKLLKALGDRYGSLDKTINAPGVKMTVDEIESLIDRIDKRLEADEVDVFDFNVYIAALENAWDELGDMAKEADEKFGSIPKG